MKEKGSDWDRMMVKESDNERGEERERWGKGGNLEAILKRNLILKKSKLVCLKFLDGMVLQFIP